MLLVWLLACSGDGKGTNPGEDSAPPTGGDSSTGNTGNTGDSDPVIEPPEGWDQVLAVLDGSKDVIFVTTDTLRRDRLSLYGYERDTMPLTGDLPWITVENLFSTSGWTPQAVGSLLTGQDTHVHGVFVGPRQSSNSLEVGTYITALNETYKTALFSGSVVVAPETGMSTPFEHYENNETEPNNGLELFSLAQAWMGTECGGDEPCFVWIQAMDPHQPWYPSDEDVGTWANLDDLPVDLYASEEEQQVQLNEAMGVSTEEERAAIQQAISDIYDEEILGVDRLLSTVINAYPDAVVVMVADHGETLFDYNTSYGHGHTLSPELFQIPFMVYHSSFTRTSMDDCNLSIMDVFPSLWPDLDIGTTNGYPVFRDGCREMTFQSLYWIENMAPSPYLNYLGVARPDLSVEHSCLTGGQRWFDGNWATGATPDSEMTAALSTYFAEIAATFPEATCAGL